MFEVITVEDAHERVKPSLLLEDDFDLQDGWIKAQLDDVSLDLSFKLKRMSSGKITYDSGTIPLELFTVVKQIVIFSFNRQRSEGLNSHSEGGEAMSWKDVNYDIWEKYSTQLRDFVEGVDYANGFQMFS